LQERDALIGLIGYVYTTCLKLDPFPILVGRGLDYLAVLNVNGSILGVLFF
jgi:hypothetical protein